MIVAGGNWNLFGHTLGVEIVDLKSSSTTCATLPNLPYAKYRAGAAAFLGQDNNPIICGGYDEESISTFNDCVSYQNNRWIKFPSMLSGRVQAAISPFPQNNKKIKFLVTGGSNDYEGASPYNTGEILTHDGWQLFSSNLPFNVSSHCMLLLNSTSIIMIGGYTGYHSYEYLSETHIFNTQTNKWTQGPSLKIPRSTHTCAKIKQEDDSNKFAIIVVGGFSFHHRVSVEILDEGASKWMQGPNLPFSIGGASIVEDKNGGVILIGGYNILKHHYLDTLFHLPHARGEWKQMPQKLKMARNYAIALLVPDDITNCKERN